jgi:hypothetical protein
MFGHLNAALSVQFHSSSIIHHIMSLMEFKPCLHFMYLSVEACIVVLCPFIDWRGVSPLSPGARQMLKAVDSRIDERKTAHARGFAFWFQLKNRTFGRKLWHPLVQNSYEADAAGAHPCGCGVLPSKRREPVSTVASAVNCPRTSDLADGLLIALWECSAISECIKFANPPYAAGTCNDHSTVVSRWFSGSG